jgi:hypothetical protein
VGVKGLRLAWSEFSCSADTQDPDIQPIVASVPQQRELVSVQRQNFIASVEGWGHNGVTG